MPQSLQGSNPSYCGDCTPATASSVLSSSDLATQPNCGTQKQPTVLIGVPVPGDSDGGDMVAGIFTSKAQFLWPAVNGDITIAVDDSSLFVVGLWVYFVSFGYLKVVDIPGAQSITLRNVGTTGSAVAATAVPTNTAFILVGEPKPDVSASALDAAVKSVIATELPPAVDEAVDSVPRWDAATVNAFTAGRLAMWGFNETDGKRRLYYLTPLEASDGYVATLTWSGDDLKPGLLRPATSANGDLAVFDLADPLDATSVPRLRKVSPTDLSASLGDGASNFRLMGFVEETIGSGVMRKAWKALKKLILPSGWVEAADIGAQTVELVVLEPVDSGKSHHFRRLAPQDGKMLVGSGGNWALQSIGSVFVANAGGIPVELANLNSTYAHKSAGEEFINVQLTPSLPPGASVTHVWLHFNLGYTNTSATLNPAVVSDAHRASVGLYFENIKFGEASSMQENNGTNGSTGFNSATVLVKLDGANQINFRVKKETVFDAASEEVERVSWVVNQIGFIGSPE